MPIVNFSFDYRRDPYGQRKILTGGGHLKLTHLVPFVASVQRGPEVMLLAAFTPGGKGRPADGDGIGATFVLPLAAEVWEGDRSLPPPTAATGQPLAAGAPLFLRYGDVAAMIRVMLARNDSGRPARLLLARDGQVCDAQRVTAQLADGPPQGPVLAAVWVRAAEGLDEASFAAFRRACLAAGLQSSARIEGIASTSQCLGWPRH
jgi:hypothetical protein